MFSSNIVYRYYANNAYNYIFYDYQIFSLVHVNECGEVKGCTEADVLASCLFRGFKEEVSDALINGSYVFEFCDKWTDFRKSC